jgi:thiamine kinase-like enzyme
MQALRAKSDTATLQTLFQERLAGLWQAHEVVTACRIINTHYKEYFKEGARSYLANAYEVTLCNTVTNESKKQIIYSRQYKEGYSQQVFSELISANSELVPLYLEDMDMIIWYFPNDPALPHLAEAVDPEKVKKHLSLASQILSGVGIDIEIVNYRPEIRCTAWYELHNESSGQSLTLFGKIYGDNRHQDIYQRLQWLREHTSLLIPPLAGCSDAIKTFWQEKLEGQPLLEVINAINYKGLLEQAAQRLTTLNHCNVPCPVRETNSEQLKEANKKIRKLQRVFPGLQERLVRLQSILEETLSGLEPTPQRVVHGDFHLRQMLLHQNQVVLFDFDECSLGDPVEDVANFIADLHTYSFNEALIEQMSQTFLESYAKHSDWSIPFDRLAWHLQIQFINRAYRSYLQQKPDLAAVTESYIALAEMKCISTN